jgi:hypothetical protein
MQAIASPGHHTGHPTRLVYGTMSCARQNQSEQVLGHEPSPQGLVRKPFQHLIPARVKHRYFERDQISSVPVKSADATSGAGVVQPR